MSLLVDVSADYLAMQVRGGADALMLFDTWAGQLSCEAYVEFVLPETKRLISKITQAKSAVAK